MKNETHPMKATWAKMAGSLALAVILLGAGATQPVYAATAAPTGTNSAPATGAAVVAGKEEVVYANLFENGAVDNIYVVNSFEVTQGGLLTDHGSYSEVANLSTLEALTRDGTAVSGQVDPGSFYYQGTATSHELPWNFAIAYFLNGVQMDADEVAGKSGALEIKMSVRQNPAVNPVFYENFMLQVSITLDTDKCTNIASDGAAIANAGKSKVISHTVMPGKDANIVVSADVAEFTLSSIEIAGMPFSMSFDIPETDELTDSMVSLSDAITALNDGVGELADGVTELNDGVNRLVNGSVTFADGLNLLGGNSADIIGGSQQIYDGIATAAAGLNGDTNGMDLSQLSQLPDTLDALAGGLATMSGYLVQTRDAFAAAYGGLESAIAAIPDYDAAALSAAIAGSGLDAGTQATLTTLVSAAQTVKGAYFGTNGDGSNGAKAAFDGMAAIVNTLTDPAVQPPGASIVTISGGLSTMATQLRGALQATDLSQLAELASGMAQLASKYGLFHSGLVKYADGVAEAARGYAELHSGLADLHGGTGELEDGTWKLHDGTAELADAMVDMPDTMQVEIDKLLEDYDKSDFKPVSFVSGLNTKVSLVQFVFMTPAITLPEAPAPAAEAAAEAKNPWDRFVDLF